jgi:hypothetical protein
MANLTCCDLWGNEGGDWVDGIAPQYGTNGNISADPLFCDPSSLELSLDRASPCLPPNTDCEQIGAWGIGCDAAALPVPPRVDARLEPLIASPNPSTGRTTLRLVPPAGSGFTLDICDPLGRVVRSFHGEADASGPQAVVWDARDTQGSAAPAGVYFLRLRCGAKTAAGHLVLIR